MADSLNLSLIGTFFDQASEFINTSAFFENDEFYGFDIMRGVKYKAPLNYLDIDLYVGYGHCNVGPTVSTINLDKKEVTVCEPWAIGEWCSAAFNDTWLSKFMREGSYNPNDPTVFLTAFNTEVIGQLRKKSSADAWKLNPNCTSIEALALTASGVTNVTATSGTFSWTTQPITVQNALPILEAIVAKQGEIPAIAGRPLIAYTPLTKSGIFTLALRKENLYHFAPGHDVRKGIPFEGTYVTLYFVEGMNGLERMYATTENNFVIAFDKEGEEKTFQMWYSEDDDKTKFRAKWKQGVQIKYEDRVIAYNAR